MLSKFSKTRFDRESFNLEFKNQIPNLEELFSNHSDNNSIWVLDYFIIIKVYEEYIILELETGTIINWYKNLGRCNMSNKKMTILDLKNFITKLNEDIKYNMR